MRMFLAVVEQHKSIHRQPRNSAYHDISGCPLTQRSWYITAFRRLEVGDISAPHTKVVPAYILTAMPFPPIFHVHVCTVPCFLACQYTYVACMVQKYF
jgi:hypothetical protein